MPLLRRASLMAAAALLAACGGGSSLPAGQMDSRTYRVLVARGADLTVQDVEEAGAVQQDRLASTFVAEGGSAPATGLECYYAETLNRRTAPSASYQGVARFCFRADGTPAGAERRRADLAGRS